LTFLSSIAANVGSQHQNIQPLLHSNDGIDPNQRSIKSKPPTGTNYGRVRYKVKKPQNLPKHFQRERSETDDHCSEPAPVEHAVLINAGRKRGDTAVYQCLKGHTGKNLVRVCNNNGEWSGNLPVCQKGRLLV